MKMTRHIWKILVILLIIVICPLSFCAFLLYSCDLVPYIELARINVGNNRTIFIYGETCWEISRGIYYEAHEGRKVIISPTLWDFDNPDENYNLEFITADNQSLVGIFDSNRPINEFFIIIDFRTGESWPRFMDGFEISLRKKNNFFERLQKENPSIKIPTPPPTASLPTAVTTPSKPTPTSTLVVQPTYYHTPEASNYHSP